MSPRLQRFYGAHHLHFITCSCYRRKSSLRDPRKRDRFLEILEQVRKRYRFVVVGYVVMPEHIHLLISEPEVGTPSTVMQVVKQRSARALLPKRRNPDARQANLFEETPVRVPFWQARFYDFNVWTDKKKVEKLRYMHQNPVKRGLVGAEEDWWWSSFRFYEYGEVGVSSGECGVGRDFVSSGLRLFSPAVFTPAFAKNARTGHPRFLFWNGDQNHERACHPPPDNDASIRITDHFGDARRCVDSDKEI